MDPAERLERFERALERLLDENETDPILVEGIRDEEALRELGATGEIIVYNRVGSMIDLADRIRGIPRVIVLMDWDRKGGQLGQLVRAQVGGEVELDYDHRKEFSYLSLVKCVEDLVHARRNLIARAEPRRLDHE